MKNKIAILFGGTSSERIISLSSGNAILNSLIRSGYNAHLIDTRDFPIIQLKKQNFNIAYITLHGKGGEDGSIQGFLEYLYIPYTGSNMTASSIAIDKLKSKILWKFYSLPIGPYIYLKKNIFHKKLYLFIIKKILKLGLPVFIKPNRQGSSIGITLVDTEKNIINALNTAFFYDDIVLIEKYLDGQEYTISILGKKILPSIRIYTKNHFYDYNAKYRSNHTQYHCPSGLNKNEENKAQKIAKKAWNIIGCTGCGRIDMIMDKNKKFWLLEINTIPGMTDRSLVPIAAKKAGITFDNLVLKILHMNKLHITL